MKKDMLMQDVKEKVRSREEIRQAMSDAFKANDNDAYAKAVDELMMRIGMDIREEIEEKYSDLQDMSDERALAARGVKPLTKEEKDFYKALEQSVKMLTL